MTVTSTSGPSTAADRGLAPAKIASSMAGSPSRCPAGDPPGPRDIDAVLTAPHWAASG